MLWFLQKLSHWFIYTLYLIVVDFRHDLMIILVLSFDKPSFKNLSLTHDRPSTLSLLLLSTNFSSRSDEQGFLCWLVLLMGVPLSFSLFLSKTVGSANGVLLVFLLLCLFLSSERTVIYNYKVGKHKIAIYSSLRRMRLLRTHLDLVCKT